MPGKDTSRVFVFIPARIRSFQFFDSDIPTSNLTELISSKL